MLTGFLFGIGLLLSIIACVFFVVILLVCFVIIEYLTKQKAPKKQPRPPDENIDEWIHDQYKNFKL